MKSKFNKNKVNFFYIQPKIMNDDSFTLADIDEIDIITEYNNQN